VTAPELRSRTCGSRMRLTRITRHNGKSSVQVRPDTGTRCTRRIPAAPIGWQAPGASACDPASGCRTKPRRAIRAPTEDRARQGANGRSTPSRPARRHQPVNTGADASSTRDGSHGRGAAMRRGGFSFASWIGRSAGRGKAAPKAACRGALASRDVTPGLALRGGPCPAADGGPTRPVKEPISRGSAPAGVTRATDGWRLHLARERSGAVQRDAGACLDGARAQHPAARQACAALGS
jgi:hypothetical protein